METKLGVGMDEGRLEWLEVGQLVEGDLNVRGRILKADVEELVPSIRESGVIQPLLVMPMAGEVTGEGSEKPRYVVVAGHRRLKAARLVARELGEPLRYRVPALVRELGEDEARELMLVENLQRRAFTPLEEARGFCSYVNGGVVGEPDEERVALLADRTGIRPDFIRRRMEVLRLPSRVLTAWDAGEVGFGALEWLMRVPEDVVDDVWDEAMEASGHTGGRPTVELVHRLVMNRSMRLSAAKFNVEKAEPLCGRCRQNTAVQMRLWGMGEDEVTCLNPACFMEKQRRHMEANWRRTALHREVGTARPVFRSEVTEEACRAIMSDTAEKCLECPDFVTVIWENGDFYTKRACAGPLECMQEQYAGTRTAAYANDRLGSGSRTLTEEEKEQRRQSRLSNLAYTARESFWRERLLDVVSEVKPGDESLWALVLYALMNGHYDIAGHTGIRADGAALWNRIEGMKTTHQLQTLRDLSLSVLLEPRKCGERVRAEAAGYFGIDANREFQVTEEYLKGRTTADLVELVSELGLDADGDFMDYLRRHFGESFRGLKKAQLIKAILESGVDLRGRIPSGVFDDFHAGSVDGSVVMSVDEVPGSAAALGGEVDPEADAEEGEELGEDEDEGDDRSMAS